MRKKLEKLEKKEEAAKVEGAKKEEEREKKREERARKEEEKAKKEEKSKVGLLQNFKSKRSEKKRAENEKKLASPDMWKRRPEEKKEKKERQKKRWKMVRVFRGHRDGVWEVTNSPAHDNWIASASADRTARVWCVDGSSRDVVYVGHTGSVNSVRLHPRERFATTAGGDRFVHVWKFPSAKQMESLNGETHHSAEEEPPEQKEEHFSEENEFDDNLISAQEEIWQPIFSENVEPPKEKEKKRGTPPRREPTPVNVPRKRLAKSKGKKSFVIRSPALSFVHKDVVVAAEFFERGDKVVSASWDKTVKVWDSESGAEVHSFNFESKQGHSKLASHNMTNLTVNPAAPYQFSVSATDGHVRVYDVRNSVNNPNFCWVASEEHILRHSDFTHNGELIVTGGDDKHIKIWDLRNTKQPLHNIKNNSGVNKFSISHDNKSLAIPMDDRKTKVCDFEGERTGHLQTYAKGAHKTFITSTCWSNDNSVIFTSGFDRIRSIIAWCA